MDQVTSAESFPIRLGTPAEFARARAYFRDIGFDEDNINKFLPVNDEGKFDPEEWDRIKFDNTPAKLRLPFDVFIRGESIAEQEFRSVCDDDVLTAFLSLGLLRRHHARPDQLVCPVWVYPLDGFAIVSDRFDAADGDAFVKQPDILYAGLNDLTKRFIRLLPNAGGGDALDLCGGCGIGALHLARTARSATSTDITPRSTFFTEFNARLNDIAIESLCGDLYEPTGNRQFDVISAHPPFVPSVGPERMIFRDADDFGESISRQIVRSFPERLRVGGTGIVVCAAWDASQPIEQRAREWLGDAAQMFDVVAIQYSTSSIEKVADGMRNIQKDVTEKDLQHFMQSLRDWGARQRVYGGLVFRKCAEPVTHAPLRLHASTETTGADVQRVLDWRQKRRRPDFAQRMTTLKPRLSERFEMNAHYVVDRGELAAATFVFQTNGGIFTKVKPDTWIAPWITRFNGRQTVADHFAAIRAAEKGPPEFTLEWFADFVGLMAERGFVELEYPT
jgi:SAM-dependent methyltransferase